MDDRDKQIASRNKANKVPSLIESKLDLGKIEDHTRYKRKMVIVEA